MKYVVLKQSHAIQNFVLATTKWLYNLLEAMFIYGLLLQYNDNDVFLPADMN